MFTIKKKKSSERNLNKLFAHSSLNDVRLTYVKIQNIHGCVWLKACMVTSNPEMTHYKMTQEKLKCKRLLMTQLSAFST